MALRVLIVDDSKVSRLMTAGILRQLHPDASVIEADNGASALAAITQHPVDAAILDMNMPGMNGIELAQKLRQTLPQVRIALLTANVQAAVVARATEQGLGFFRKPVTEHVLREILNAVGAAAA